MEPVTCKVFQARTDKAKFRVKIRSDYHGRPPRRGLDSTIEGRVHSFSYGWDMEVGDYYPGETAWIADRDGWPENAPHWIASGDLEPVEE